MEIVEGPRIVPDPNARTIRVGDPLTIVADAARLPGRIERFESWGWILARSDDGRCWLETMMNASFASWSRLVEIEPWLAADPERLAATAERIARDPRLADVADVPGARRLLPAGDGLDWDRAAAIAARGP